MLIIVKKKIKNKTILKLLVNLVIEKSILGGNLCFMRIVLIFFILPFILCTTRFTYEDAVKRGTIDAYYRFVTENPDSPDTEQAISTIKDMLFTSALEKRDVVLIKRFLSDFPNDPRSKTLSDILDEIRFEEAKRRNTKSAYEVFIQLTTNSKLRDEAKVLLQEIEYNEVKDSNDITKLEAFLKKNASSYHFQEINNRLKGILFEKIKSGDVYFAEPFLTRFSDNEYETAIIEILLGDIINRLDDFCLLEGLERFNERIKTKIKDKMLLNVLKEKSEICKRDYFIFSTVALGNLKKVDEKRIFFENIKMDDKSNALTLLKNYYKNLNRIQKIQSDIVSEDPAKRRMVYLELKYYPFSPQMATLFIEDMINGTILEKLELAEIIRERLKDEVDKRLINFLFFINRDKPIYSIYRSFFFEYQSDFESDNLFLNKTFANATEDIFLQYMLIDYAYQRGYNSFIRSIINEHLRQLFSITSGFQSLCQQECPKKILFEIKGISHILTKEEEMAKILLGENSDEFNILRAKKVELLNILERHKFVLEQPLVLNPSANTSISTLETLRERSILRFVYQAEPDREKRDNISKLIQNRD